MSFDRPLALITLAFLPALLAGYVLARRRRARYAVRFTNLEVLRAVAPRFPTRREWAVAALCLTVVAFVCVAAARPHVYRTAPVENATVLLVIDTSRSMLTSDIAPSRLQAAKAAASGFLERVPDRLHDHIRHHTFTCAT